MTDQPTQYELSMPFYGPMTCGTCGGKIVRASLVTGGRYFTYPSLTDGWLYPNTPWLLHEHQCEAAQAVLPEHLCGAAPTPLSQ